MPKGFWKVFAMFTAAVVGLGAISASMHWMALAIADATGIGSGDVALALLPAYAIAMIAVGAYVATKETE